MYEKVKIVQTRQKVFVRSAGAMDAEDLVAKRRFDRRRNIVEIDKKEDPRRKNEARLRKPRKQMRRSISASDIISASIGAKEIADTPPIPYESIRAESVGNFIHDANKALRKKKKENRKYCVNDFVATPKKQRGRKVMGFRAKEEFLKSVSEAVVPSTSPFINKRLSRELTQYAISLNLVEHLESGPNDCSPKDIIHSPRSQVDHIQTWTTKAQVMDEWPSHDYLNEDVSLISRDCIKKGFLIEVPRKQLPKDEHFKWIHEDKDAYPLKDLVGDDGKVVHYIAKMEGENVVITTEVDKDKDKKFVRAILRDSKSDQRIFAPTSDGKMHRSSLQVNFPKLDQITRVKRDQTADITERLLKFESDLVEKRYKFGVLYAKSGQTTELEFFNNENGSDGLYRFLGLLADKIELFGWNNFKGGLDNRERTTGEFSYYKDFRGREIMFHVSTLIPYYPNDEQQLERKRHLGNDIVVIIFMEGDEPFDPLCFKTHYTHIFVVVKEIMVDGVAHYQTEWAAKQGVQPFKPYETFPSLYKSDEGFAEYFLTKLINSQRAAMSVETFQKKIERTRNLLLKEVVDCVKK